MSAPIEAGACYRDSEDGEIVRILRLDRDGLVLVRRVGADWPGCVHERFEDLRFGAWERVPDPTPAVIDDEPAHDEATRQERIDATARVMLAATLPRERRPGVGAEDYAVAAYATGAYEVADVLEAARERYIAKRKGAAT